MSFKDEEHASIARIVIVNFNSGHRLQRCINALAAQSYRAFEVSIVDNGSTDKSAAKLMLPDARFTMVSVGRNLGFAAGCNLGSRGASAKWLIMLNPDAYATPSWLAAVVDGIARYPDAAGFGCTQVDASDPSVLDGCGDAMSFFGFPWRGGKGWPSSELPVEGQIFAPCGAAAVYRRDIFEAQSGFDESLFCYQEDVDLGARIRLAGGSFFYLPRAAVEHEGGGVTPPDSPFSWYHNCRNRTLVWIKIAPLPLLIVTAPLHLAAMLFTLWRGRNKPLPVRSAIVRGTWDAISGIGQTLKRRSRIKRSISTAAFLSMLSWSFRAYLSKAPQVFKR